MNRIDAGATGGPESSPSRARQLAFALVPVAVVSALLLVGMKIGQHLATRDLEHSFVVHGWNETLGGIVAAAGADEGAGPTLGFTRSDFAQAYLDPARAEQEMDGYSFAVPMVPSPFVGTAPAPGRHANATINAQQFRHETDLEQPKPAGRKRVFVTGGSTAYGAGAPSQSATITGYLQALVDARLSPESGIRYEIVNAAAPAWASTQERIWIEQRLSELAPDLVVSLSGINDVHWGALGYEVLWFRTYDDEHYFQLLNRVRDQIGLPHFADVAVPTQERIPPRRIARNLAKNIALATAALELQDVPYVFALQPMIAVTGKRLTSREKLPKAVSLLGPDIHDYFRKSFQAIRDQLESGALHFVDLTGVFDAEGADAEIFLDSYHFGDRGNQRIAAALFQSLEPWLTDETR